MQRQSAKVMPDPTSDLDFVGMDNVQSHELRLNGVVPFRGMRSAGSAFTRGDVLYGRLRPYLNKVWVADREGACSGELLVLRPIGGAIAEYIALNLHSHRFVVSATEAVTGDRPRIDFDQMAQFAVAVPPQEYQVALLEEIDQLFEWIEEGQAALTEAGKATETYRQALLKAAVTGELTADWRAENVAAESGEALLARILDARRANWAAQAKNQRKKYVEPRTADTEDLPKLPTGWCWATADQLCDFITKGTTPAKGRWGEEAERSVPFLRVTNLTDADELDFTDAVFITPQTHQTDLARSKTLPGDVLMNIVGPPLGQVSIVPSTYAEWNINQAVARFRPRDGYRSELLSLVLRSQPAAGWLASRAKATSGQVNLTLELCRSVPIPVPPAAEQEAICRMTNAALAGIGEVRTYLSVPDALRQSILTAAFRGDLIEPTPISKEPA